MRFVPQFFLGGLDNRSMSLRDANMQSSETAQYLFTNKAGEILLNASVMKASETSLKA
jgi:hypothetical protein